MKLVIKPFIYFAIMTLAFSFPLMAMAKDKVEKGNVIHSFKSGKMQCQSQIDSNGQIAILLTSLTDNTQIKFDSLALSKKKQLLKVMMLVKADTDLCAGWVDAEPVTIAIDPLSVNSITLTGRTIYQKDRATVLVAENG